ncbi:hypothetical protein HXX76_004810 [Chlamydomonas incerta]|uniref:Uncharacterized protein n=1 Tax=Chlamydomonas incerta TaxID=51695 RepID=A0A835TIL5_CHLIN|nr:hypothetical protein HXX76_004810 [Chlamydomonas incerta]|eukprot:KAG2439455.1 hypothetical protein HXX76_004810 [Chlamydomonas incerta]
MASTAEDVIDEGAPEDALGEPGSQDSAVDGLASGLADTGSEENKGAQDAAASSKVNAADDSDDDLDKLLAEDTVAGDAGAGDEDDVVPPSDQTPAAASTAAPAAPAAATATAAADDDDDAESLGLSRSTSIASASGAPAAGAVATAVARVAPPVLGSAVQHDSAKSLGGKSMGALSRALSAASSDGLDDLPDNLDAMETRGASHGAGAGKGPRTKPLLAGLMESEQGKGAMAAMPTDLRDWSNLKRQQPGAAMVAPPGRPPPGARGGPGAGSMRGPAGGHLVPLPGKPGAPGAAPAGPPPPVHSAAPPLLNSRTDGPKANPMHNALMNGSAARQSHDRTAQQQYQQPQHHHHQPPLQHGSHASLGSGGSFVSRKNSNTSGGIPAGRQRSLNSHISRKASISEPGPLGPQAEWKQLPSLAHGARLHPHDLRQPSSGNMRGSVVAGASVSKSVAISAPGLADDKLPALPALMGARGAPPRAAELMRNASRGARADSYHTSHQSLPGLNRGGLAQQASRALRMPSKKSFKGDRDF